MNSGPEGAIGLIWGGQCRGSVPLAWGGPEGNVLSKVVLQKIVPFRDSDMASSAVLGCVLAALLEDYSCTISTTSSLWLRSLWMETLQLTLLVVSATMTLLLSCALQKPSPVALSCTARMRMPMLVWRLRAARRATQAAWQHT